MNILVTGGCGFIGSNLVKVLMEKGSPAQRVVNLDALTYAGNLANLADIKDARYHFVHGDILNTALVSQILQEHQINAVLHLAAESHVDRSIESPGTFVQTNVMGTLSLLQASLNYWQQLVGQEKEAFRFLHVSTDEVFGSLLPGDPAFTEASPYQPSSPYSASKAGADHLVRSFSTTYGLPVLLTNCSNNYGPYQFPEKLIPLMILNAGERKPLPLYGQGDQIRDWLYVTDHCHGLLAVLEKGRVGETYALGGQCEKTNLEVVNTLCDLLDERAGPGEFRHATLKTFVQDRPGHDKRYAINISKIKKELGWEPRETFASGLKKTVHWYLENKSWCQSLSDRKDIRQRRGILK
jgi:dTDP-glucose 4,6-dehydratase